MSFTSSRGGATNRGTGQFLNFVTTNPPLPPRPTPTPGKLYVAGQNSSGELGLANTIQQRYIVQVGTANNWLTGSELGLYSAEGYLHMIKSDNTLWASGNNAYYQLGFGNTTNVTSFTQVGTANNWAWVTKGSENTEGSFAITTTGDLYSWGYNYNASLGQSNLGKILTSTWQSTYRANITTPTYVTSNVIKTVQMYNSTAILKNDGTIWTCGMNQFGQLGYGITDTSSYTYPSFSQESTYKNNWIDIAPGQDGFFAINTIGDIYYTGGPYGNTPSPVYANSFIKSDNQPTPATYISGGYHTAIYIDNNTDMYGLGVALSIGPGYGPWWPVDETSWTSSGYQAIKIQVPAYSSVRLTNSNELYAAGFGAIAQGIGLFGPSSTPLASLVKIGTTQTWQSFGFSDHMAWYISST